MKNTFSKKQLGLAVTCALALSFVSGAARAQAMAPLSADSQREVWTESTRTQVWKNPYGLCWHSPYGPPSGHNECNPAPVAQYVPPAQAQAIAPPPAPVYLAPAPAPAPIVAPAPQPRKVDRN